MNDLKGFFLRFYVFTHAREPLKSGPGRNEIDVSVNCLLES